MGKFKEIQNNLDVLNWTASEHDMVVTYDYHEGENKYCAYRTNNIEDPLVSYLSFEQMDSFFYALELVRTGKI